MNIENNQINTFRKDSSSALCTSAKPKNKPENRLPSITSHKRAISIQNEYLPLMDNKCKVLTKTIKKEKKIIKVIKSHFKKGALDIGKTALRASEALVEDIGDKEDPKTELLKTSKKRKPKSMNQQQINQILDEEMEEGGRYIDFTTEERVRRSITNEMTKKIAGVLIRDENNQSKFISPVKNNIYNQSKNFEHINNEGTFKFRDLYSDKFDRISF